MSGALGDGVIDGLAYAFDVHRDDVRKGTRIPYGSHLLAVASLVMEDGGDQTQVIAALLHDAAEDHGGEDRLADIERRFGPGVAAIVRGCSDSLLPEGRGKEDWRVRKQRYIDHLAGADEPTLRVSLADKLHNARCILRDYREIGEELWGRFATGRGGVLWYLTEVTNTFESRAAGPDGFRSPMLGELRRVVDELDALAGQP